MTTAPLETAAPARQTSTTIPIPIVSALVFGSDPDEFYRLHAAHPVIVRDCFPADHPLMELDLDAIEKLMGNIPIHVYGAAAESFREVPAKAVFDGVRGIGEPYNVVDFYLAGTTLGGMFEVPAFLRNNWFLQPPANQDRYEKSLILSPAGAFTPLHLDSYAMQGWMFLIAGHKTWTLYSPDCVSAAFHPVQHRFFDSSRDSLADFPGLSACDRWQGDIGRGDLLYFPAGWIHEVATHTISYGVGGSVLNDYQIEAHMQWWLWERKMHFEGSLDLKHVIESVPEHRFSSATGKARAQAALQMCRTWESQQR